MIRLALLGDHTEVGAHLRLSSRLREASLTSIAEIKELDSDAFDAAVVCSKSALEDNCRFAVTHGKHVLASTLPASSTEAPTLMHVCQTQGVRLMVGFSDRFLPSVQAIKQSLDSGQLGDPGLIRIHRWYSNFPAADPLPDIDLAIWMFQAKPTEVYAVARRASNDHVDYLQIHLGFPAGGMGLIDVSDTLSAANSYFSLSLIGSSGAAHADDHHNQQLLFRGEQPVALKTGDGDAARLAQLQEFVDAINENREPAVTGADAQAASHVCKAAWQSIKCGGTVRLSGEHYEC